MKEQIQESRGPGEELCVEDVPRLKSRLWRHRLGKASSRRSTWEYRTWGSKRSKELKAQVRIQGGRLSIHSRAAQEFLVGVKLMRTWEGVQA